MVKCIALLRGINVGRAKRVAMEDLRALALSLGHRQVRTLLNSGNLLFETERTDTISLATELSNAIAARFEIAVHVVLLTAGELDRIVAENPLKNVMADPARGLVAFVATPEGLARLQPLTLKTWAPDQVAIGGQAAYLWCAEGILESKLQQAFSRLGGEVVTTRNWSTVLKLLAAVAK